MITYDYPFNERVRVLLRLEDLFIKVQHHAAGADEFSHHCALLSIFQILDLVDRSDLKTDLMHELDRQRMVMEGLRGNPVIAEEVLNEVVGEIEKTSASLRGMTGRIGQPLRENDWLMGIKQRAVMPGGACEFDVPSYHYWLAQPAELRREGIEGWLAPLLPLYDALRIILHILRGSGSKTRYVAQQGAFQQMLGGAKPAQMLRVTLSDEATCFPEVSANKYAINIRFNCLDGAQKPRPFDADVSFDLILCNL
ncbi:cell division protein ZapD [Novimethylophilus kurashikiensis]|uniref:Cell division protein ZapD n=1 Tax=Novimethylophilus kurashikiensis TaxID=1825523 RepID=A0A2R5F9F8_9PROT|nr:cell division protein ZapD [Novimethylophilus kurashikiensis]GBG13274.1 cell division protein ZapD [Novimethylophilus kurashikiensis]